MPLSIPTTGTFEEKVASVVALMEADDKFGFVPGYSEVFQEALRQHVQDTLPNGWVAAISYVQDNIWRIVVQSAPPPPP